MISSKYTSTSLEPEKRYQYRRVPNFPRFDVIATFFAVLEYYISGKVFNDIGD